MIRRPLSGIGGGSNDTIETARRSSGLDASDYIPATPRASRANTADSSRDDASYTGTLKTVPSQFMSSGGNCWEKTKNTFRRCSRSFKWRVFSRKPKQKQRTPGRLLARDNSFAQSTGILNIHQIAHGKTQAEILALYGDDWFHVVLSFHSWQLFLGMFVIYTLSLLAFAGFYVALDRPGQYCGIAANEGEAVSFQTAFAFSLITASTIGYGFPSSSQPFFNTCVSLVVVVYFQVLVSLTLNALIVGLTIQRLGRADTRSHQVVFSNKACIRAIHGHFYIMFQVYDLDRRHPVVEAHVRCYAVTHETDGVHTANFQTQYMRLQNPNDELGGVLFLSVPCTVVHCIDQWSPLMPEHFLRETWVDVNDDFVHNAANRLIFPSLLLRGADTECGDRSGTSCPICGETFPTDQHLLRHIRYLQWEERQNGAKPVLLDMLRKEAHQADEEDVRHNELEMLPSDLRDRFQEYKRKIQNPDVEDIAADNQEVIDDHLVYRKHVSKINRLLECYADLSLPLGHLDVDMNLLPTEIEVVPERTREKREDVFKLFEEIDEEEDGKGTAKVEEHVFKKFKPREKTVDEFREAIEQHITKTKLEIIVLVEGIEASSSNTFQARHSYTADDIEFDKIFAPVMEVSEYGNAQVNLSRFHHTIPIPSYVDEAEPVQSHT